MTSHNIDERVLNAFRIEHREQLERLRSLFDALATGRVECPATCLQEALRLAHSFKGGARICDLRPAEQLGHALEAVLERIRGGLLQADDKLYRTMFSVLDSIEDWMAAVEQGADCPDTEEALHGLQRLLQNEPPTAEQGAAPEIQATRHAIPDTSDIEARLRQAFELEYATYRSRLRELIDGWKLCVGHPADEEIAEASRICHTLAGAAQAAAYDPLVERAAVLERLLKQMGASDPARCGDFVASIEEKLDALEAAKQQVDQVASDWSDSDQDAAEESDAAESATSTRRAAATHAMEPLQDDTVRVSAASLDGLMRSADVLLAEGRQQMRLSRGLTDVCREVEHLDRDREAVRALATSRRSRSGSAQSCHAVLQHVAQLDKQIHALSRRVRHLSQLHQRSVWRLQTHSTQLQREVRQVRMISALEVFRFLRKLVRDQAREEGKQVDLSISGLDSRADRTVLQLLKEPVMHIVRNCITHGIESPAERVAARKPPAGRLCVQFCLIGSGLQIQIDDDGRGLDLERIRDVASGRGIDSAASPPRQDFESLAALLFEPGFSTSRAVTELAGRGLGLSVVRENVRRLQGDVKFTRKDEPGAQLRLSVPLSISTRRALLVQCGAQRFALPLDSIERLIRLAPRDLEVIEGQGVVHHQRMAIAAMPLADLLGLASPPISELDAVPFAVVKAGGRRLALRLDATLDELDSLVHELDVFASSRQFLGGMLLEDGEVVLLLNPVELIDRSNSRRPAIAPDADSVQPAAKAVRVLVVDDSFTTRTLEKSILETHGYDVTVAVDGSEALAHLRRESFAVVITDIEMPRMDGLELLAAIKADARLARTPVILVSSRDKQEDMQRGLELGAEAYIVKRKFDHQELLNTIAQVL